jgi:hypothetical protein
MTRSLNTRISFDTLYDSDAIEDALKKAINDYYEKGQLDEETVKSILRHWVTIDVKAIDQLTGGISGAGVYRLQTEIRIPTFSENAAKLTLPSIIVKTNTMEAFRAEFENYQKLPSNLRDRFARMEKSLEPPIVNEAPGKREVIYYMIMEDLLDYRPLHDIICKEKHDEAYLSKLVNDIWKSLRIFHNYKEDVQEVHRSISLYIGAIQDALIRAIGTHNDLSHLVSSDVTVGGMKLCPINDYWPKLLTLTDRFEPPFATYVHGDLHSKNILIRDLIEGEKIGFDVKLIDIDKMRDDGDYLYDLGELISYIEVIGPVISGNFTFQPKAEGNSIEYQIPSNRTADFVKEEFLRKMKELDEKDKYCNQRLSLAQTKAIFSFIPYVKNTLQAKILYCEGVRKMEQSLAST